MSTLREELVNKVMNQWDGVNMDNVSKKTLGEKIFEWVKNHPYSSVAEIERGVSNTYQGSKVSNKKKMGRPPKQAVLVTPTHEHVLRPRMAQAFNPEMFVQDLSLREAKAVFDVLKGYFSG